MAQNLASKYSPKVDERFRLKSVTDAVVVDGGYDWTGVTTVNVYTMDVATMNDYSRSGLTRYGTAAEVGTGLQALTLTKDRSFTATIDKGNFTEEMMVTKANEWLKMQVDEVVVPEIDQRRIAVLTATATANSKVVTAASSATNAFEQVLAAQISLDDDIVPEDMRVIYVTPTFASYLLLDDRVIKGTPMGQEMVIKGQIGEAAGFAIKKAPASYFPANTSFVTVRKGALLGPKKINDLKIHDNPPGVNGSLIEGRFIYDAFVLDNKADSVYWHKIA